MNPVYEKLQGCLKSVREKTDFVPKVAIVLGSGLGDYANLAGLAVVSSSTSEKLISQTTVKGKLFAGAVSVENGIVTSENDAKIPVDTHKIVDGTEFAKGITTLTTWVDDLNNLTNGTSMFEGCTSLSTFIGDLSSLEDGTNMFAGCNLSAETALDIVETLPTYTDMHPIITIKVTSGTSQQLTELNELAESKGWTLDIDISGGIF